jgi:hypothetical protein
MHKGLEFWFHSLPYGVVQAVSVARSVDSVRFGKTMSVRGDRSASGSILGGVDRDGGIETADLVAQEGACRRLVDGDLMTEGPR